MEIKVWILIVCAILQAVFSQDMYPNLRSNLLPGKDLCPGEEVIFTCVTRRSSIIAWMSDEYIGGGRQLEFSIGNEIGDNKITSFGAIATLVNKSDNGGITVLESQLQVNISANFTDPSVTCVHGAAYRQNTSRFRVLVPPDEPQATTAYLTEDAMARCRVHVSWTLPINVNYTDVMYFVVLIDGMIERIVNATNKPLISTYFSICSCAPRMVSVSTVNYCDIMGQSSQDIPVYPEHLEEDCDPDSVGIDPERECPSTLEITIALILMTIVIFIILSIMLPVCAVIINKHLHNIRSNLVRSRTHVSITLSSANVSKTNL